MKRALILLMIAFLILSFSACTDQPEENIAFYYLRTQDTIRYGDSQGLIAPVIQTSAADASLDMLLQQYLSSPNTEDLISPFPKGTYLLSTIPREDTLVIVLSREFSTLDGIQLTLAGACLTATCHTITGMEKIQLRSGDMVYDFNLRDYVFLDCVSGK